MDLVISAATIFLLRIADVSLGTLRISFLVRGRPLVAGGLGFLESLVWLTAAAQVLANLDQPVKFVAYAAGYATGTILGVHVERLLAVGDVLMRIVAPIDGPSSARALRDDGFVVTEINAEGRDGHVRVSFCVLPRRRVGRAMRVVREVNPRAFVSIEGTTLPRAAIPAARVRG